jgi:hypothetical protein
MCETSGCRAPDRRSHARGYADFAAELSGLYGNHGALGVTHGWPHNKDSSGWSRGVLIHFFECRAIAARTNYSGEIACFTKHSKGDAYNDDLDNSNP